MKKIITICAAILMSASIFLPQQAWAQAPGKMSYQAVVRDANDALISSTSIGMQISILQDTPSGTAVYIERHFPNTNANGLVSIEIGTGLVVSGDFSTIDWANGPYFIKTETDPTGGANYTITGTSQLLSVPYALYAETSGTPGPQGPQGPAGADGQDGESAYNVWLSLGNSGTQTDFINSLTGPQGPAGADGAANAWGLSGNAASSSNFIGTTNNQPIRFKMNNLDAGFISVNSTMSASTNNVAFGYGALAANTTGYDNIASGAWALYSNTAGSNNVALGAGALYHNTEGNDNIASGYQALYSNTTGSDNIASGSGALSSNTEGSDNIASGYLALNKNTIGSHNIASGAWALFSNTTGWDNVALGSETLYSNTGSNNIGIGFGASTPSSTASNQVRIGNTSITYAGVQVNWTTGSDRRYKDDIKANPLGLSFINTLNPVSYVRKNDEARRLEYGFIAQEIEEAFNKAGLDPNGVLTIDDEGYYGVRYADFISISVKAIQELSAENEEIKAQNDATNNEVELLKTQNEEIKAQNAHLQQQIDEIKQQLSK